MEEFRQLLQRISDGDNEALKTLIEDYSNELLRVIRRHIRRDLRKRFDSEDFAQAVWMSLYRKRDEVAQLDSPQTFGRYLAKMAMHKVIDEGRRQTGAKRDIKRDVAINGSQLKIDDVAAAATPSASEVVASREQLSALLANAPESDRQMVQWRLDGLTFGEIAGRLQLDERTIRRRFTRLQRKANGSR